MQPAISSRARRSLTLLLALAAPLASSPLCADDESTDATPVAWQKGPLEIRSAGPLAFGPEGILFASDPRAAAVFAVRSSEKASKTEERFAIGKLDERVAGLLGTAADRIRFVDLAIHPVSGAAYLSVARGRGPEAGAAIVRVDPAGKMRVFSKEPHQYQRVELPNPPAPGAVDRRRRPLRMESITDLGYVDGKLVVAGLSNEEFASTLRAIPYPFSKPVGSQAVGGTSVEIFHGAHGEYETHAPVRTFVPLDSEGLTQLYAAYTCTPLVAIPVEDLEPGAKIRGKTVAELGNRNRPLDMIAYEKGGDQFLLIANSARGVMKMPAAQLAKATSITERVGRGKTAGAVYETLSGESEKKGDKAAGQGARPWEGILQLDRQGDQFAVVVRKDSEGQLFLESHPLP